MAELSIAHRLAAFVAEGVDDALDDRVLAKAEAHILDTFGAALAGATSEEVERAGQALRLPGTNGPASLWGTPDRVEPRLAALLNGIAAHAFELDDTAGCDHSGAVVLPAAVAALAATDRSVSGREFIAAVVAGYEVGRRALEALGGYRAHNEAGWHSTGTCGTLAAAAAASRVLGLDADATAAALGHAGSLGAGLWAFIHDGAMTKRVHAGRAAEAGLTAALLARAGVTGPGEIFADRWGGFLRTFGRGGSVDPEALTRDLGRSPRILVAAIKPYASCRDTHYAIDAVGILVDGHGLRPDDIGAVEARLSPFVAGMVGGHDVSALPAAQMSLPYGVAARIALGRADLAAYGAGRRSDPGLLALAARVAVLADPDVATSDRASVTIRTRDGRAFRQPTAPALGSPDNPLAPAALRAKFDGLARLVLPAAQADRLAETCLALRSLPDARAVTALLATSDTAEPQSQVGRGGDREAVRTTA